LPLKLLFSVRNFIIKQKNTNTAKIRYYISMRTIRSALQSHLQAYQPG